MAQYTIELDDDTVASIEAYLATQRRVEHDPETNRPRVIALFADAEDFITKTITQIVANVVEQFPTPAMRQHLIAKRQAELAMEATIRPTVKKVVAVPV